jgi:AbiV family abortive infection protein
MRKRAPTLDADVLAKLALAAARTADTHLRAAKYLLDGEYWPEAYAIAATGFEEAGKAWLAVENILSPENPTDLRTNHPQKLRTAYAMLTIIKYITGHGPLPPNPIEALASLDELAEKAFDARNRGLFADPCDDGSVTSPADVSEDEARAMVSEVKEVLDTGGALIDMSTLMWAAGEKGYQPDAARSALARAAQALKAGPAPVDEFITSGGLSDIEQRVEAVLDDPEFLRRGSLERILRAAASDAYAGDH